MNRWQLCFNRSVKRRLVGDCKAALSQVTADTGSWRTRHLRIRSAKLRECIQSADSVWSAEHCDGAKLVSDGLTKPLQYGAFTRFVSLLQMRDTTEVDAAIPISPSVKQLSVKECNDSSKPRTIAILCAVGVLLLSQQFWLLGVLILLVGHHLRMSNQSVNEDKEKKEQDRKKMSDEKTAKHPKEPL